ncbi:MAG: RNA polymerase sigma-54 factor [Pararhodobacter sp.]
MALTTRLELRAQQRLALTPDVRLRLTMLRMGPAELAEELAREAARNPFLLYEARVSSGSVTMPDAAESLVAPEESFQENLRRQVGRKGLSPRVQAATLLLITELRADGFLDAELEELAGEHGIGLELLEQALFVLHSCEPAGIGARSVSECLRLQLVDNGLTPDEAQATLTSLPDFARRDWKKIGTALGLDEAAVRDRAILLRGLSPRPVIATEGAEAAPLIADLRLVRLADGAVRVEPADSARPAARLDLTMVHKAATEGFAPELLERAKALLGALDQRGRTLARIGEWLAQKQSGFFLHGAAGLVPATRIELAGELGLHPSTISRALAGKAVDIDGRLWPLSVFFSTALPGTDGPVSSRAVQRKLAELIAAEPAGMPLSDDTLARMLRAEGVDIARRTIAKYRQGLRIPPSSTRRRAALSRRGG